MASLVAVVASCARIHRSLVRRCAHRPELDSLGGTLCPQVSSPAVRHQCTATTTTGSGRVTQFVIGINYNPEPICFRPQ